MRHSELLCDARLHSTDNWRVQELELQVRDCDILPDDPPVPREISGPARRAGNSKT
jgi:hypothetical protein